MHVLLTRSKTDASAMAVVLEDLGFEVTSAPLLEIAFEAIPASALDGADGIVATSRNAIRALAASEAIGIARGLPLHAVGEATARLARDHGFARVVAGPGDGARLAPLLEAAYGGKGATLVHPTGDHIAFDLLPSLENVGIALRKVPAYRSVAAQHLPARAAELIEVGELDAVILMSPRSAATWAGLIAQLAPGSATGLRRLTHVCLSPAVAAALGPLPASIAASGGNQDWKIAVADHPDSGEILALVKRLAADEAQE